jgi:hypothetical protein
MDTTLSSGASKRGVVEIDSWCVVAKPQKLSVNGRFGYSDLKEADLRDYGICMFLSWL